MDKPQNPFVWYEVYSPNDGETKEFYSSLFGWETSGMDMGPHGTYTMFHMHGQESPFGGIVQLNEQMEGMPPHWAVYIACEDVDVYCEKVKQGGGAIVVDPFDIPGIGRTALVRDPHGAMFFLFRPTDRG